MTFIQAAHGGRSRLLGPVCLLALACLLPVTIVAQDDEADAGTTKQPVKTQFDITVRVTGGEPPTGTVEISLFNSAESFMTPPPYLQTSGPMNEDGTYTARFGKVPPGEYAVVVAHDENDNGKLDTGFMGFGGESYAFSNDAKPLFGRPDFDEVKFRVSRDTRIRIRLD